MFKGVEMVAAIGHFEQLLWRGVQQILTGALSSLLTGSLSSLLTVFGAVNSVIERGRLKQRQLDGQPNFSAL